MAHSSSRRAWTNISVQSSYNSSDSSDQSTTTHRNPPYDRPALSVSPLLNARIGGNMNNNRVYAAGGNIIVNDVDNDLVPFILSPQVASGAMFDSDERHSAGRCHAGTRQRMFDRVMKWIMETNPAQTILWMYGPAGAGKSDLMQSICEFLRDSDPEKNGASFFFARGNSDRGKATKLFVTLAYQLALQFPAMRAEINDALRRDPTLPTKSMAIQLRSLIVEPLLHCQDFPLPTPILFIDGLDECGADDDQRGDTIQGEIITLISQALIENNIPIRFMLASRPEYWISDAFEDSSLSDITLCISLRDDSDADSDIRTLLTEMFEQIRLKKSRVMGSVPLPWPPEHIVERFVKEASGQYIYASTIQKFVGDHPFKSPKEQLRILTTPGPRQATAYSDLDRLYATITSAYPEWDTMKRVLGGLLIDISLAAIQVFLEVPQSEIALVLDALRSLIDVVPPTPFSEYEQLLITIFGPFEDEEILFFHLSFREFLLDEARSGLYHIDVNVVHSTVVRGFFGVIQRNLDEHYEIEPHISCDVSLLEYRRMMMMGFEVVENHFHDFRELFGLLRGMMETFRRFNPGRYMNHPAYFMRDMELLSALLKELDPTLTGNWITFCSMDPYNPDAVAQYEDPLLKDSFIAIVSQLQYLASMACKIGVRLLSWCRGEWFSITPILFLLRYIQPSSNLGIKFDDLLNIPGSTADDKLSSILQHRHIINVECSWNESIWLGSDISIEKHLYLSWAVVNLAETCDMVAEPGLDDGRLYWPIWTNYGVVVDLEQKTVGEGWLCNTIWTNQHVSLVCGFLKSIMNNLHNDWERLYVCDHNLKDTILGSFFKDGGISDIHGKDYFGNNYHLSFLEVMVDLKAWLALFPSRPHLNYELKSVIAPVLCWFNRQLANPETAKLIEDHDASLLSKMTTTMNSIFQTCFVPLFTTRYFSRLVISTYLDGSIEIKVSSSNYSEQDLNHVPPEYNDIASVKDLHNKIFVKGPDTGGDQSIIPRSEWYPYLAAYLLNICVKYLHFKTNPDFNGAGHDDELFPWIVQYLPHAQNTPQNLDALRAIKYLSTEVEVRITRPQGQGIGKIQRFYPPSGFCSCVRAFLEKYEPYVLSSEELSDFELWMQEITEVPLEDWDDFFRKK